MNNLLADAFAGGLLLIIFAPALYAARIESRIQQLHLEKRLTEEQCQAASRTCRRLNGLTTNLLIGALVLLAIGGAVLVVILNPLIGTGLLLIMIGIPAFCYWDTARPQSRIKNK